MSAYKVVKCNINDQKHIIAGLVNLGVPLSCIEVHDIPQTLQGYQNDTRGQKANVIVRRGNVNKYLSNGSSNDLGFEKKDGVYQAHVSDYDMGWWNRKRDGFLQKATESQVVSAAQKRGYKVTTKKEGNKIKLLLKKLW